MKHIHTNKTYNFHQVKTISAHTLHQGLQILLTNKLHYIIYHTHIFKYYKSYTNSSKLTQLLLHKYFQKKIQILLKKYKYLTTTKIGFTKNNGVR